jgi:hypothetical protein
MDTGWVPFATNKYFGWVVGVSGKNKPSREPEPGSDDDVVDWSEYVREETEAESAVSLDAKDYIALFIASLETIFLPLVLLSLVLIALALIFRFI